MKVGMHVCTALSHDSYFSVLLFLVDVLQSV